MTSAEAHSPHCPPDASVGIIAERPSKPANSAPPTNTPLSSTFPVLIPELPELHLSDSEFEAHILSLFSPSAPIKQAGDGSVGRGEKLAGEALVNALAFSHLALHNADTLGQYAGRGLTQNGDVTFVDSGEPLVNLFYALRGNSVKDLDQKLDSAWAVSPAVTLKIIFNCRSIHLGKSEHYSSYEALGWLYRHHPVTFLHNLQWLVRPIIPRKAPDHGRADRETEAATVAAPTAKQASSASGDDDYVVIDKSEPEDGNANGEAVLLAPNRDQAPLSPATARPHGYWKDLLNILVLAARGVYDMAPTAQPSPLTAFTALNHLPSKDRDKRLAGRSPAEAAAHRDALRSSLHHSLLTRLESDKTFRALYATVARLFASQLRSDHNLLSAEDASGRKRISLAAKWAPTSRLFHDRYTFVVSAIAEILFPPFELGLLPGQDPGLGPGREDYLRHARELYRWKIVSPLRAHIGVVERDLCARTLDKIKYDRLPSVALSRYSALFARKDHDRFKQYVLDVSNDKAAISGAVLNPGLLVKQAIEVWDSKNTKKLTNSAGLPFPMVKLIVQGQWNSLVKRIRESGSLKSAIAVCDVSGSMMTKRFSDSTAPLHHAIALSLIIAEVAPPPFGGKVITFSANPTFMTVGGPDDSRDLVEKVGYMVEDSNCGFNTDLVAVFTRLILKSALEHSLPPEEMVKNLFVFSDMQFDSAVTGEDPFSPGSITTPWSSSYERISDAFKKSGYPLPNIVFWNLEGAGYGAEAANSMPVEADREGTALVSGYSQALIKAFLEDSGFEKTEVVQTLANQKVEEADVSTDKGDKAVPKMTPLNTVLKAVAHPCFDVLTVRD